MTNFRKTSEAYNGCTENTIGVHHSETASSQRETIKKHETYLSILKQLREDGQKLRADQNQPSLAQKPEWFDRHQFEIGKSVYSRHFMGINFAHLSGLLLLVRVNSIYRTLVETGKSDSVAKLFNRYYHTLLHVKKWYEGDIFDENSYAHRSLLIVRGMHTRVSSSLNDCVKTQNGNEHGMAENNSSSFCSNEVVKGPTNEGASKLILAKLDQQVHISEFDIMLTQFAFVGLIVTKARYVGLLDDFDQKDLESLLHFWRVIGYYLGATDKYNICSYKLDDVIGLCQAMIELEYKTSIIANPINSPPGTMCLNIVRALKFIPLLTVYGIIKYLYELLEVDTSEIVYKKSRYSQLSYTLIKLVMTRLLAYRALRSFNNGLTRLSVYLVGKVEDWFANRLTSNYGQELKM